MPSSGRGPEDSSGNPKRQSGDKTTRVERKRKIGSHYSLLMLTLLTEFTRELPQAVLGRWEEGEMEKGSRERMTEGRGRRTWCACTQQGPAMSLCALKWAWRRQHHSKHTHTWCNVPSLTCLTVRTGKYTAWWNPTLRLYLLKAWRTALGDTHKHISHSSHAMTNKTNL